MKLQLFLWSGMTSVKFLNLYNQNYHVLMQGSSWNMTNLQTWWKSTILPLQSLWQSTGLTVRGILLIISRVSKRTQGKTAFYIWCWLEDRWCPLLMQHFSWYINEKLAWIFLITLNGLIQKAKSDWWWARDHEKI